MSAIVQKNSSGHWIFIASLFFFVLALLLIATTIVISLISVYLPSAGSNIVVTNNAPSASYRATYTTNLLNANKRYTTDSTSLGTALATQLGLSKSSTVKIVSSQFLPVSSNERKKRATTCDRDTNGYTGDHYIIEAQVADPKVCHTQYCGNLFSQKVSSAVQTHTTLNLPFKSTDGSSVSISMVLCKFGAFLSASPTCSDNIRNEDETDIDCGGSTCLQRCAIDRTCNLTSDCNNATCVTGVCLGETAKTLTVCQLIQQKVSSASQVFYPYGADYNTSIYHFASSSSAVSMCSVQLGTVNDVAIALSLIGQYQVSFGIKGGGHIQNPGFSSTTGILIAMSRFKQVTYHANNQTVDIGPGLVWDEVYQALSPYNVTVIGGRVSGVGVAGLILGGGYSWKSNQYGLSIDTIVEYELVSPNSTIVYVNNNTYPDIFFGLKGGFNNFGIVTRFTMRAVPQTDIYAGFFYYSPLLLSSVIQAITTFQTTNQDPKAQIILSFIIAPGQYILTLFLFYDAPTAPTGTFDVFTNIEHYGTLQTQSYLAYSYISPTSQAASLRSRYSGFSVTQLSASLLVAINNQLLYYNSTLGSKTGALFIFSIEPFISSYFDKSQGGAYPHTPSSTPLFPINIQFSWALPSDDEVFISSIKSATNASLQAALDEGQDVGGSKQIIYPNYALENTSLSQMYGDNVARLQSIRKAWDPNNIMYLAGGFKF